MCICVALLIWYVLSFLILVTLFSVKMTINNACFLRGAPQPWPSSSLWTQPKADCRVSIGSYHVGQRLPDSGYTTKQSWVVWTHYNHYYGGSLFSFRLKLDADIALSLSTDVVKITYTWTKMLVTFFFHLLLVFLYFPFNAQSYSTEAALNVVLSLYCNRFSGWEAKVQIDSCHSGWNSKGRRPVSTVMSFGNPASCSGRTSTSCSLVNFLLWFHW